MPRSSSRKKNSGLPHHEQVHPIMNKYLYQFFLGYFGWSRYIHGNPEGKEQPLWWWDLHGNSEVAVDVCYRTIVNPSSFFLVGYSNFFYPYPKSLQLAVMTCVYSWIDMGKSMEQLFQSWWATSGAPFTEVSLESRIRKRNWRMILGGPGAPGSLFAPDGPLKQQFFKVDIRLSLLAINVFFFRISLVFFGHVEFNEHFFSKL